MLDGAKLDQLIADARRVVEGHGGILVAKRPSPADPDDVTFCEAFFGRPLPPSLKRFWTTLHNGMSLQAYPAGISPETRAPSFAFDVCSTTKTVYRSDLFRAYFAGYRETGYEQYTADVGRHFARPSISSGDPTTSHCST
jgi:hypothetical protein